VHCVIQDLIQTAKKQVQCRDSWFIERSWENA
jgi:hypothetical protein